LAKIFKDLSEQQILALAISLEETDARIYADFAAGLRADYPTTAKIFEETETEEDEHRGKLIKEYKMTEARISGCERSLNFSVTQQSACPAMN
jgi:rubrerythrin